MERLERTAAKATDRVDFYERVVRSVAREETDLKEYNEVLGKKKTKYNKVPKVTGLGEIGGQDEKEIDITWTNVTGSESVNVQCR